MIDTFTSPHKKLLTQLSKIHFPIKTLLINKSCHFIGVPMHMNMGDHLIMHGTLEFFKLNNIHIDQFSSILDYNLNKINTADVLIFAGGGNFGDLYAQTHKIRNQIILKAISQGKKIVILPQSLHYQNHNTLKQDIQNYSSNENVFLFTRDQQSYKIGSEIFRNTFLVPDMAHYLYPKLSQIGENTPIIYHDLYLLRSDTEVSSATIQDSSITPSYDWIDILNLTKCHKPLKLTFRLCHFWQKYLKANYLEKNFYQWEKNSWVAIEGVSKFLAKHQFIHTDRLHGMIFCLLLNRPYSTSECCYPKISNYINCWLAEQY